MFYEYRYVIFLLVVLYVLYFMVLLMTSACLNVLRASRLHRLQSTSRRDHVRSRHHLSPTVANKSPTISDMDDDDDDADYGEYHDDEDAHGKHELTTKSKKSKRERRRPSCCSCCCRPNKNDVDKTLEKSKQFKSQSPAVTGLNSCGVKPISNSLPQTQLQTTNATAKPLRSCIRRPPTSQTGNDATVRRSASTDRHRQRYVVEDDLAFDYYGQEADGEMTIEERRWKRSQLNAASRCNRNDVDIADDRRNVQLLVPHPPPPPPSSTMTVDRRLARAENTTATIPAGRSRTLPADGRICRHQIPSETEIDVPVKSNGRLATSVDLGMSTVVIENSEDDGGEDDDRVGQGRKTSGVGDKARRRKRHRRSSSESATSPAGGCSAVNWVDQLLAVMAVIGFVGFVIGNVIGLFLMISNFIH